MSHTHAHKINKNSWIFKNLVKLFFESAIPYRIHLQKLKLCCDSALATWPYGAIQPKLMIPDPNQNCSSNIFCGVRDNPSGWNKIGLINSVFGRFYMKQLYSGAFISRAECRPLWCCTACRIHLLVHSHYKFGLIQLWKFVIQWLHSQLGELRPVSECIWIWIFSFHKDSCHRAGLVNIVYICSTI